MVANRTTPEVPPRLELVLWSSSPSSLRFRREWFISEEGLRRIRAGPFFYDTDNDNRNYKMALVKFMWKRYRILILLIGAFSTDFPGSFAFSQAFLSRRLIL